MLCGFLRMLCLEFVCESVLCSLVPCILKVFVKVRLKKLEMIASDAKVSSLSLSLSSF